MKEESLDRLSAWYELVVILILILASPLLAYTILNLRTASFSGCGLLAGIAMADMVTDISALFSIRGIDTLKSLEDRSLRRNDHPIRPANWILMCVFSFISLVSVSIVLKGTDLGSAFLGLSAIKFALSIAAALLGLRARNLSRGRIFRQFGGRKL